MALYDIFVRDKHHPLLQSLMIALNKSIVSHIRASLGQPQGPVSVLEIGPGKGYFHEACKIDGAVNYYALDRNQKILGSLEGLSPDRCFFGEVPDLPETGLQLDVIYAAFVIEHLPRGGEAQYAFINWAKRQLRPGGLLVLQAPNAEKLGMEFWNIDYTHTFPTTKRSIAHAFYDNEVEDVNIFDVNGLMTHRFFTNRLIHLMSRALLSLYHYKVFNALAYYLFGRPSWNRGNFFFSVYALTKEENLFVVGRMPS
jgi:SAM-dependent methyltransferase